MAGRSTMERRAPRRGRRTPDPDPRKAGRLEDTPDPQSQEWPGVTAALEPMPDHGEESYAGTGLLRDRVALITGGDSGIGRAVAIAFAREGADVAIAYFDEHEDASYTLAHIEDSGRSGFAIDGDLRDPSHCTALIERTIETFGRLDILVNNAAFQMEQDSLEEISDEQLLRTFESNILAVIRVTRAALPHMKPGGVILNTGSVTAMAGNSKLMDYAATKGAIHAFTRSLAQAVADRGIRVNCVAPGPVWTPLIPATFSEEHVGEFGGNTLWGRPAQPAEIAPSFVFLASDAGRYYSGEVLAPTGRAESR